MNFSDIIKTGQQFAQKAAQKAAQPKRPAGGVRRRNETRGQFKNRMGGQSDNSDITELFKGIQQTRTRVHKGMDGNPIDPNAPKGLDKLYADNPHLKPSAGLQAQNNWQARDAAGAAAVARKKAEQEAARNPYGNVVTAPNGSRGVTNSMGQIVGTTAPVGDGSKRVFDDATGKMVPMDQWFADRNAVQQSKGMTPSPVAQAWNTAQNTKPDSMDLLFSGKPQSSPPGGAQAGMVGPPAPQGAPGGDMLHRDPPRDFARLPDVQSKGMPLPGPQMGPNDGPQYDFTLTPNAGPQYTPMMPNEGPQRPADFGPQLPYSSGEQLMALKRLYGFGGNNNPTLTALEGLWSNIFPNRPDNAYLRQLFPGLVHPQAGSGELMKALAKMYQNPAYQSLFPNMNQSEFYK